MDAVLSTGIFGGASGCPGCPGVSVEAINGGLVVGGSVGLPGGVGIAPTVAYEYNGLVGGSGPFGQKRARTGVAALQLYAYDGYGQVGIRRENGVVTAFILGSDGKYACPDKFGEAGDTIPFIL